MSCANVQPPDGGPPDKTPPKILFAFPPARALNVTTDEVMLEFSKFVSKQTVIQNLIISPAVQYSPSWNFSGKKLTLNFEEKIPTNTTISVVLGTLYTDMQGNKPDKAFTLIFSSGNRLDSGVIQGKLDNPKPEGVFIFCYPLQGINPDTLNPSTTKPRYKTQIGASGTFDIQALSEGSYRLVAVRDEFKDGLIDRGMDAVGVASHDVSIREGSTASVSLRIGEVEDRVSPQIFEVQALTPRLVRVKFSEKVDTACIVPAAFQIEDSITAAKLPVIAAHVSLENTAFVDMYLKDTVARETSYKLSVKNIVDAAGNAIADSARSVYWNSGQDTAALPNVVLRSCSLADSALNVPVLPSLRFLFSAPIDTAGLDSAITIRAADSTVIRLRRQYTMANLIVIEPEKPLPGNSWYKCTFKGAILRTIEGQALADTTFTVRFMTEDQRGYGGISGIFADSSIADSIRARQIDSSKGSYIILLEPKETAGKRTFSVSRSKPSAFEFEHIPPGAYRLSVYHDRNGNARYDGGNPYPFEPAERFAVYAQEVVIRARWTVENIRLTLPFP